MVEDYKGEDQDVRFGHDLAQVQDHAGVDLLALKKQLELSVEERFSNLERQLSFIEELRGSAAR
jgi:Tfp pilus assembly protein PilO